MAGSVAWNYPGIGFSEIDNSTVANTQIVDGVGAIVMDANQGYVNQRILSTSRKKFHEQFGDQETSEHYGHFAADQFLASSPQLYAVRATMGDEAYGFIQFPYDDAAAKDCKVTQLLQQFNYVDKEGEPQIKLLDPMKGAFEFANLSEEGWNTVDGQSLSTESQYNTAFCLVDNGYAAIYRDLQTDAEEDSIHIFRDDGSFFNGDTFTVKDETQEGYLYKIIDSDNDTQKLFVKKHTGDGDDYLTSAAVFSSVADYKAARDLGNIESYMLVAYKNESTPEGGDVSGKYVISVNKSLILNGREDFAFETTLSAGTDDLGDTKVEDLLKLVQKENVIEYKSDVVNATVFDWQEESTITNEIVYTSAIENAKKVNGTQFREITGALYNQALITTSAVNTLENIYIDTLDDFYTNVSAEAGTFYNEVLEKGLAVREISALGPIDQKRFKNIALNLYGKDAAEVSDANYKFVQLLDAQTLTVYDKIVFSVNPEDDDSNKKDAIFKTDSIFTTYIDRDLAVNGQRVTKSCYVIHSPEPINEPWQFDKDNTADAPEKIKRLTAYPSSEVFTDPTGIYKDGYTKTILTLDEPGNGDIERYQSNQHNQLVIAAVGPGEYGNNIGISIITPEVAGNAALENQPAAFDWKYSFDDEDLVDDDWMKNPTYKVNPNNLIWKKVYKINVYVKTKSQQASVWGSGLDALVREPVESFLVSNDPTVKDGNGNSMYAPYVINGQSKYIYISLNSVSDSRTATGKYAMPKQTYSIYQLTGGKNSTKHTIKEKTAALSLYADRQKCMFDVIFNVEPIESFQSKEKYSQMQRKIAEIASDRGIDLALIQVTSKAARTGHRSLSEGKLFTFSNGSYVACTAGYDRYYDSYTSNWVYLPKSVALACAYARRWVLGKPWEAPAGIDNGTIDYSNGQLLKLSDPEIGLLYSANINCSRSCAGLGEVIWCQKTALKKESALNRINVRGCINYIEKYLEQMLIPFLYKNNTSTVRSNMRNTVDSFLSTIMANGGLLAKSVQVIPDPKDTHLVYVNIAVVPAEAIEFIQVNITVNRNNNTITFE